MAYQTSAILMTLSDLQGLSPIAVSTDIVHCMTPLQ